MAILSGIEGPAHVEVENNGTSWKGYILLQYDMAIVRFLDVVGATPTGAYVGPVRDDKKFYLAHGKVKILGVSVESDPRIFRVKFAGIEHPNIIKILEQQPEDYLPE